MSFNCIVTLPVHYTLVLFVLRIECNNFKKVDCAAFIRFTDVNTFALCFNILISDWRKLPNLLV